MKKLLIFLFLFLIPVVTFADKKSVKLSKCVDGDTAWFIINKEEVKVRFLGIDSPEIAKPNKEAEPYGDNASNYTCNKLKKASKIEIEYDREADEKDKYDRKLAYVFVDGKLLEELIVKNGYANVKYINNKYKYYDILINAEEKAKNNKKGIYSEEDYNEEISLKEIKKNIKKYAKKIISNILKNF